MTVLYTSPEFLNHQTGTHPEKPARLVKITERLTASGLDQRCVRPKWDSISRARLERVHTAKYVDEVRELANGGGGYIEADTIVSPKSYDVALRAAGAVVDAVDQVVHDKAKTALCLVRPPGHHALEKSAMGFCLFNNVAIGARTAVREFQLDRVLIIDWDVHHGNGTQNTFWEDEQVGFLSIHRFPFYPGTGTADETGAGKGLGHTKNLPITFGTTRKNYMSQFREGVEAFAAKIKPQLVILSAGFDAHRLDPVGSLGLEVEDYAELSQIVLGVAKSHAGGKLVSVLEGGYNVDVMPECVELHLKELLSSDPTP